MATLPDAGLPLTRRAAPRGDKASHLETDQPLTGGNAHLLTHPQFRHAAVPAALPFEVGDSVNNALRVNIVAGAGAGGTSSLFGAPFPAAGTSAGANDISGNMAGLLLDALGNLKVNVAAGAAGGGVAQT